MIEKQQGMGHRFCQAKKLQENPPSQYCYIDG